MSRLGFYVLCGAICSLFVLGQGDMTTPKTVTILVKDSAQNTTLPPTTPEPTTKPTTENTTTTEKTTTTSTTTEKPTTSTTTTTQKTTTTSSTTVAPPTPTPTPAPPKPLPPPDQGKWNFTQSNVTCLMVQFAAQLNVTYTKVVDNSTSLAHVLLNVPANATVTDGACAADRQWLALSWSVGDSTMPNTMKLVFNRNDTTKNYALQYLNVSLTAELFPNASSKNPIELSHGVEWMTPLATSYRCEPPTRLNMTAETANIVAALTLSHLQEEAFRTSHSADFSAARECGAGDLPDAVPIAVGCALGGLVIVVLVAYLEARRRSAARGYLSM